MERIQKNSGWFRVIEHWWGSEIVKISDMICLVINNQLGKKT